jgi:hypothetical protein
MKTNKMFSINMLRSIFWWALCVNPEKTCVNPEIACVKCVQVAYLSTGSHLLCVNPEFSLDQVVKIRDGPSSVCESRNLAHTKGTVDS